MYSICLICEDHFSQIRQIEQITQINLERYPLNRRQNEKGPLIL